MQRSFTQRVQRSFYKERKRMRERFFLLKRTLKNARTLHSFEKNVFPTLAPPKAHTLSSDKHRNQRVIYTAKDNRCIMY